LVVSDLIQRAKERVNEVPDSYWPGGAKDDTQLLINKIERLTAERDRLTVERRTLPEYDDAIAAIAKENERLEAKNERLKYHVAKLQDDLSDDRFLLKVKHDENKRLTAENERLLATLHKICTEPGDARDCRYWAGEAIAGAKNETS
jgi:hypothetical protein